MKDILSKKIQELSAEAEQLVNRRAQLEQDLRSIETRLTQVVGAMTEIQKLKDEQEKEDEASEDS